MEEKQAHSIQAMIAAMECMLLGQYRQSPWPKWLKRWLHPEADLARQLYERINKLSQEKTWNEKAFCDALLHLLNSNRYQYEIREPLPKLALSIRNALLICLNFSNEDTNVYRRLVMRESDLTEYCSYLQEFVSVERYQQYMRERQINIGLSQYSIKTKEEEAKAKDGMINGLLVERFGLMAMMVGALDSIKAELQKIIDNKIFAGYMNEEVAKGYISRANAIIDSAKTGETTLVTMVQYAQYLVDDIRHSAGVLPRGMPKYSRYETLLASMQWFDNFFCEAKVNLQTPILKPPAKGANVARI